MPSSFTSSFASGRLCFSNGSPDFFFGRFRARFLGLEDGWGLLASELFLFALIEGIKLSKGNLNLFLTERQGYFQVALDDRKNSVQVPACSLAL